MRAQLKGFSPERVGETQLRPEGRQVDGLRLRRGKASELQLAPLGDDERVSPLDDPALFGQQFPLLEQLEPAGNLAPFTREELLRADLGAFREEAAKPRRAQRERGTTPAGERARRASSFRETRGAAPARCALA
jgi:hypothetical protein